MASTSSYGDDLSESLDDRLTIASVPQRSTAISNKLSSVLSASYADSEIREALDILDKKQAKNSAETRRGLRLEIQRDVIDQNGDIVKDFGNVAERLRRIGTTVDSLQKCCRDIRQHVVAAHRENAPVLEEASTLLAQREELETKRQLLDAFNKHFIITEEDSLILMNTSETVNEKFFAILKRVKQIYADCQVLLGTENQRLGLELMDQSSRSLNLGYQKLYRWIQMEFKTLNLEIPQISPVIRRALRTLAERPSLFQSCLDFLADAREHVLTDAFYAALTGSVIENDRNPMTKPIEFHAHDPLRYVGDMLAWTHSATVSEREALESLFITDGDEISRGIQAGREAEPWSSASEDEVFDGQKALRELVNRIVAGAARALRQRVEQVLQNHEDPVLLYKITNLIKFYRVTFEKLLGSKSTLLETLSSTEESSLRHFRNIMSDHVSTVQADIFSPPANLRVPDFLDEALTQFSALMKSYDSSLTPAVSRTTDFEPILYQALDPFISTCEKLAAKIEDPDGIIFRGNCLSATRSTLSSYDFVHTKAVEVDEQIENLNSTLIGYQHAFFLHTSGLHPLIAALAPLEDDVPDSIARIPALPPFQTQALTDTSQTLDDFLPSALMDAMENLKHLSSTKLAQEITAEGAERFCEDFEFVEGKLVAVDELRDEGGEEDGRKEGEVPLRSLFPRTSGEIRVLLS